MICIWSSWCHCHPIISCSSRIQNGLPFWCRLTITITTVICIAPPTSWPRARITQFKCCFSDTPYDAVNRNVLSLRLNSAVDWHSFNSVGSWFHRRGAATENARSPIFSLGLQTAKSPWAYPGCPGKRPLNGCSSRSSSYCLLYCLFLLTVTSG